MNTYPYGETSGPLPGDIFREFTWNEPLYVGMPGNAMSLCKDKYEVVLDLGDVVTDLMARR